MSFITDLVTTATGHRIHVERHATSHSRETVILVNGALATTESFRQTVKSLSPNFDAICYDLPYYGKSATHNPEGGLVSCEDEVAILLELIERYQARHLMSISWGGVAALRALAQRPASIRTGIIGSFSPQLNPAMRDYITTAQSHLLAGQHEQAASLLNETVGRFLPRLLRVYNQRYLANMTPAQYEQTIFHIEQMRTLPVGEYLAEMRQVDVPVLFVNGERDDYTTFADIQAMGAYIRDAHFKVVPEAGHFLDLESRRTSVHVGQLVTAFMRRGGSVVPTSLLASAAAAGSAGHHHDAACEY